MAMTDIAAHNGTLAAALWPQSGKLGEMSAPARNALLAVAGSLLLWACAKIQVPFYPVPVSMGTFAVLAIGMAYGPRLGAVTLLLYLAEGAAGLPVFANTPERGIGLAARGWDRNVFTAAAAMLFGNALIYIPGLFWLGVLFGWDKPILDWGLTPFVIGDLLKLALVAAGLPLAWKLLAKRG
jgi:biotin transport system substrate-specific component